MKDNHGISGAEDTPYKNLKKSFFLKLTILFSLMMLIACRTPENSLNGKEEFLSQQKRIAALMRDLSPRNGKLFFFAAITRKQYRNRELEECRQEAAAQLSRFFAINGVSYVQTNSRITGTQIIEGGEIAYNSDLAVSLEKELSLEEELRTTEGTCALYSYKPKYLPPYPYEPARSTGPPDWTRKGLTLEGFQSAVGLTGPQRFLERTIQQADKNALATLVKMHTGVMAVEQREQQNSGGSRSESVMTERSSGTVKEAYIISRWQDDSGNMYSLVLCPVQDE